MLTSPVQILPHFRDNVLPALPPHQSAMNLVTVTVAGIDIHMPFSPYQQQLQIMQTIVTCCKGVCLYMLHAIRFVHLLFCCPHTQISSSYTFPTAEKRTHRVSYRNRKRYGLFVCSPGLDVSRPVITRDRTQEADRLPVTDTRPAITSCCRNGEDSIQLTIPCSHHWIKRHLLHKRCHECDKESRWRRGKQMQTIAISEKVLFPPQRQQLQ